MLSGRTRRSERAFTLLELMIASVVMAIIFMGLISSITGAFLATDMANRASEAQAIARRLLEEMTELSYADMLLLDGNTLVTSEGMAAKCRVFETSTGLLTLEVEVCRPEMTVGLAELAAMDMDEFRELEAINGSRVRFTTLSTGMMARAEVTYQTGAPAGSSGTTDNGTSGGGWTWW